MMEATYSSETSIDIQLTTRRYSRSCSCLAEGENSDSSLVVLTGRDLGDRSTLRCRIVHTQTTPVDSSQRICVIIICTNSDTDAQ
jgi:hypothetical protein